MAKDDWPKSYVIPSLALSLTAAALLIWRIRNPAAPVDAWTVALVIVFFLPWLRTVFETIEFPGGGSVTWRREVKAVQERQADEIHALQFLLARFLTEREREMLQRLAAGDSIPFVADDDETELLKDASQSLKRLGLVSTRPEILESAADPTRIPVSAVDELFEINQSGRHYLELIAKLPAEDQDK